MPTRKNLMTTGALVALGAAAVAAGDATVTYNVTCATGMIEKLEGTSVRITAKKGNKTLDDTFTYPKGSTANTAGAHTAQVAAAAGFVQGTDFIVSGGTVVFKGVDEVDGGTGSPSQMIMTWMRTTGVTISSAPPGGKIKPIRTTKDDGQFLVTGFGVKFDATGALKSTPQRTEILYVDDVETATEMVERFRDRLVAAGWTCTLEADDWLHVEALPDGTPVATLSITPMAAEQLFPGSAGRPDAPGAPGPERDHWKIK